MYELINKAFIIKIKEIEENDALIFVLLEDGKVITLKAKGFQKENSKNRQSIHMFSFCELEYFQSENYKFSGTLKRGTQQLLAKPTEVKVLNQLNLIINILLNFQKKQLQEKVFELIYRIVKNINYKLSNISNVLYYLITMFREENYLFIIDKCCSCGYKDKISGFSLKEGGLVCRECDRAGEYDLPVETLKKIITLFSIDKIVQLQLIHFFPEEETKVVDMFYNFGIDILGWNIDLIKHI